MPNKDQVLLDIECCTHKSCRDCSHYSDDANFFECGEKLLYEAHDVIRQMDQQLNDNIGHWVVLKNCSNEGVYCSECQTKIFNHYPIKKKYSYFCPHCGTRMEGQEEIFE